MKENFIEELRWRGMIQDIIPETEEYLNSEEMAVGYLGIDPTADSLHIGHLCGIMMLSLFQMCGHKPLILIGGATGMIGDPSGKSEERNLLTRATIDHNVEALKKQLERFLDFDPSNPNCAEIVNNLDWLGGMSFLDFSRNVGKLITVNYMMAKDSVKKRIAGENGISFTEFTYQLLQGYDFAYLNKTKNCMIQMGGSDQWGNMTTGLELIRKLYDGKEAYALTCPLLTKSDGSKFGKTERGNIWLDPLLTSPFEFYQFWMNVSDEEAIKYLKIFTKFSKEEIEEIENDARECPEARISQTELAQYLTHCVHGKDELDKIVQAQKLLYAKNSIAEFLQYSEERQMEFLDFLTTVIPSHLVRVINGNTNVDVLSDFTGIYKSRGDARKAIESGSVSVWGEKLANPYDYFQSAKKVGHYWLVKTGKKNYHLIIEKDGNTVL